jgi:NAD+ synthase
MMCDEVAFSATCLRIDAPKVADELAAFIREEVRGAFRRRSAVVGISGGVDSAVTLGLCARGLGREHVLGVLLPERESSEESIELALDAADAAGVETVTADITAALEGLGCYATRDAAIRRVFPQYGRDWKAKIALPGSVLDSDRLNVFHLTVLPPDGQAMTERLGLRDYLEIVASSNLKQRTRMTMLYHIAEARSSCVVGTANKNEYDQGFFVKYGDGGYDIGPIRHLYKTQVYQLAEHLGVPERIRNAVPTTDTYPAPSSQEEFFFRMPFDLMDLVWYGLDHGVSPAVVAAELGLEPVQVERAYLDLGRKRATTQMLRKPPVHPLRGLVDGREDGM